MFCARAALMFATSGHSGVDRIIGNLLPELGKTRHEFHLLTLPGKGPYPETIPDNLRRFQLPAFNRNTVLPALCWYLLRYRPFALLTASHKLNRSALIARQVTRVPVRIAVRMGMSVTAKTGEMKPAEGASLRNSMRRWYPRADAVIAPSLGVGNDLLQIAGIERQRLHVIPNPLINSQFFSLAEEPVSHPWFAPSESPVILSVGSLEERKDFSTLIRAFSRVRRQRECRLVILGEGRKRDALQQLANSLGVAADMDMPGFDANPYRYMRRSSVFVLSSRREGASAVIVEALACGTPVVSTDCPSGPAETLQNGRYGRLVPIGEDKPMAEAISASLDDPPAVEFLLEAVRRNRTELAARKYLEAMGLPLG